MIDWKEINDGDTWELFARDFLIELGFVIDAGPGRGADAGKDLLVSEQLRGRLASRKFTWLVSCKNFSISGKSVGPDDETNITDRIRHHSADGFMGFYSTLPSSRLIERLQEFSRGGQIAAYEIFDSKKIEGHFVDTGLSKLALRYFSNSYDTMRPIQKLFGEYKDLRCEVCDKDILILSVRTPYTANIVFAKDSASFREKTKKKKVQSVHIVCKGDCDRLLQSRLSAQGFYTGWQDISDLANPLFYLENVLSYMNILHDRKEDYTEDAHEKIKSIYVALSQRTLREITKEDEKRYRDLSQISGL
ncbi:MULTISPECIES: hypothetical protein [Inquilinus]|uniref:Restriction endonuclease type IV Mrr domain-containing protein n=1 Tax=Inquilinus ginsengisoli TaxID=363840 RepID=A0ABU1JPV5_9PROT|nr:hypothetical protein [Inquilinus ginsengisoli]MDR6290649.1 hypothetical protein [Inquilinus ginsengisoli]